MKLEEYLDKQGISQSAFGALVNATQATINRYVRGLRAPSLEMIGRIEKATNGLVRAEDWVRQNEERVARGLSVKEAAE